MSNVEQNFLFELKNFEKIRPVVSESENIKEGFNQNKFLYQNPNFFRLFNVKISALSTRKHDHKPEISRFMEQNFRNFFDFW